MGCGGSKNGDISKVEKRRQRLSVGAVEKELAEGENPEIAEEIEEDRGMITGLDTQTVIELLSKKNEDGDRPSQYSIGSETDQDNTSFGEKSMKHLGDKIDLAGAGLGYCCKKGQKPESPNQDSWFILKVDGNFTIYGVFDGHGKEGHDVSNFVKEYLPKLIIQDSRFKTADQPEMLKDVFFKVQDLVLIADQMKKVSAQSAGTTATLAIQDHTSGKLTMAHVADSTAVLASYKDKSKKTLKTTVLTRDHKPNLWSEKARIKKAGGRVVYDGFVNHRVYAQNGNYPGLNMSRCLGDLLGHQDAGLTCEPEVSERNLGPLDHMLLLCSDGVWEFMKPQEAVKIVQDFPASKAMEAAECLAKEAWDRWDGDGGGVVDDITVLLAYL